MQPSSLFTLAACLLATTAAAVAAPAACPPTNMRVVRSAGGVTDYLGSVPGLPELCHMERSDGRADYYFGVWRTNWPGVGDAIPALLAAINGPAGTRAAFDTRAWPGQQFHESFVNGGTESMTVGGKTYTTLLISHEREGYDGNTYHSVITSWRDVATGITLRSKENQISGQSYGPATTWAATSVEDLPAGP